MGRQASSLALVDGRAFRAAMSQLASGVVVVTVNDDLGQPHGMTATAVSSVSAEPPQLLVCVNASTRTHEMIIEAGSFGVSILAADQPWLSDRCARPGSDKGLDDDWLVEAGVSRTPAIAGGLVHLDCELVEQVRAATHTVFIGGVRDVVDGASDRPLIHFGGRYCGRAELASTA